MLCSGRARAPCDASVDVQVAVHDLCLGVPAGERFGLLGPNGAGAAPLIHVAYHHLCFTYAYVRMPPLCHIWEVLDDLRSAGTKILLHRN